MNLGCRWTRRLPSAVAAILCALAVALLSGCAHTPVRSFTFVQMCDPQLGFGGYQADLVRWRQAIQQINQLQPDFVVVCGDLVNGASEKSYADFNAVRASCRVPCYCAPGNHDVGNAPTPGLLQRYRKWVGKDYYAFEHRGCTFVIVNSQLWKAPVPGESEKQDQWLRATLKTAAQKHRPIFVVSHFPLFEKTLDEPEGYFNLPKAKRQELLKLFKNSGVVALLAGHTHKTSATEVGGIQMVNSETTSRNFDNHPFGFRVWHIGPTRPYRHEFVPLEQVPQR